MQPSKWVIEQIKHIPKAGHVLDLAAGSGRHSRFLLTLGFKVTCVDIDVTRLNDLEPATGCRIVQADLEGSSHWPFTELFSGILVTNYLHRPLFKDLMNSLCGGGVLIYETFMSGNEQYGKPRNPDFLLEEDELRNVFDGPLRIINFTQGYVEEPKPAIMQRICARKPSI
jgi:SAM-dependent methyltransferase